MNKEQVKELAEINATYIFDKVAKQYGEFTDEYVRHFYNKLAELRGGIDDVHTCNCQHNSNSRDNEPCCRCDNRTAKINKARVNSLEIIAHMLNNKHYYELKYRRVGEKDYSVGYSSYDLKTVLGYIDTYFEIVKSDKQSNADRIRNMSDEELAEFLDIVGEDGISSQYADVPCDCCCEKTECSKCWKDWLQSEAE